jgi:hypothetical protein
MDEKIRNNAKRKKIVSMIVPRSYSKIRCVALRPQSTWLMINEVGTWGMERKVKQLVRRNARRYGRQGTNYLLEQRRPPSFVLLGSACRSLDDCASWRAPRD